MIHAASAYLRQSLGCFFEGGLHCLAAQPQTDLQVPQLDEEPGGFDSASCRQHISPLLEDIPDLGMLSWSPQHLVHHLAEGLRIKNRPCTGACGLGLQCVAFAWAMQPGWAIAEGTLSGHLKLNLHSEEARWEPVWGSLDAELLQAQRVLLHSRASTVARFRAACIKLTTALWYDWISSLGSLASSAWCTRTWFSYDMSMS